MLGVLNVHLAHYPILVPHVPRQPMGEARLLRLRVRVRVRVRVRGRVRGRGRVRVRVRVWTRLAARICTVCVASGSARTW